MVGYATTKRLRDTTLLLTTLRNTMLRLTTLRNTMLLDYYTIYYHGQRLQTLEKYCTGYPMLM